MADLCDLEQQLEASCCSENDGIEKPPIISKMSVIALEKAASVTMMN